MVIGTPSFYKRKDGRWTGQVKVKVGTKTSIKYIYANQRKVVVEKMNKFIVQHKALINRPDMLYENFLTNWLSYKRVNLKATSYDRLESIVRLHLVEALGGYEINNITAFEISELLNEIKRDYSFSTLKKCYDALRESFQYACDTDVIDKSPMRAIEKPRKNSEIEGENCFTDEELKKFKEVIFEKYKNGKYKYVSRWEYILILNTGLRLGEILALRFSDIDLENKRIRVNKNLVIVKKRDKSGNATKGYELKLQTTKSNKERYVPINETALKAIEEIKKERYTDENSLLIQDGKGGYLNPRSYTKRFYTVLKKADLPKTGLHILRHQFASELFANGVDIKIISLYLGHGDIGTTEKTYIHFINKRRELKELKICI